MRPAGADDAAAIARVYGHHVLASFASFEEVPPDAAAMEARRSSEPRLPWLVATIEGDVVGFAYAGRHRERAAYRWDVDVSVYLDPSATGRGIGSALYARLLPEVRQLGYLRAYAGIALPNEASVRLHESFGFTPVGVYHRVGWKLGGWRDVGWWELALEDDALARPPEEPRRWG